MNTIQEQYNQELNKIWREVEKYLVTLKQSDLDNIFENFPCELDHPYSDVTVIKFFSSDDIYYFNEGGEIKPILIQLVLKAKNDKGEFLFPEGQQENPEYKILGDTVMSRFDYEKYYSHLMSLTPKTLADLFLQNCLLSGDDKKDQIKIENLKKVKFD